MCGISGILALDGLPVQSSEISSQLETIVHRGPDQGAIYLSNGQTCGLGIRRLSIIDVAGGNQPLSNEDGSIHLVYNGETYNHKTLRASLELLDHRLKTHNDGEVIVHGYETWGIDGILRQTRGMFAFALWHEAEQQLFLARDRFGIKPLYYSAHAGRLYFASEIKAILTQPDFPRRVNLAGLQAMLTLGFVPGPATMFEGVYKLPPAHYLIAKDGTFHLKNYWRLEYQETDAISESDAADQFLTLLEEAVELRLMSEVPLGALLSGGLDSGSLVALLQARLRPDGDAYAPGDRLKTVSIGFDQAAYDEAPLARELAQFLDTEHHPANFTNRDFDDYPQIMHHLEEPQCSATAVPIYKLYQTCRQIDLTVVLTGEGADELLAGYHWHRGDALVRPMLALPDSVRQLIAGSPLPMSAAARRVLARGATDVAVRYQDWLEVEGSEYRQQLFSSAVRSATNHNQPNSLLAGWIEKVAGLGTPAPLNQFLWLETQTRMADFINFEVDKMSMAHSIEARVPFLDHKLWEFSAALPPHYKLKGRIEKHLLRRATRQILPKATRTRSKKGLAAPYAHWLRSERLPDWAEAALSASHIRQVGLFDPNAVQSLRQAHQLTNQAGRNQPSLGALLMGVLSTQIWYNLFIA